MKTILPALAAAGLLAVSNAHATPVPTDGSWFSFTFYGEGVDFADQPFTFTLASAAVLTVTDLYIAGDQLAIYNNGGLLGLTSAPLGGVDDYIDSFDAALQDARWSSASWSIGPGSYSITGTAILSPYGAGTAGIRVVASAVPEADPALAFGLGFGTLAFAWRRRARG